MTAAPAPAGAIAGGGNPGRWTRAYLMMMRFDVTGLRSELPFMVVIQILMGAGMAVIYGFFLGDTDPARLGLIVTAAPVLALVPVGFVLVPSVIGRHKLEGTYDFVWSLPVPRTASAASTFTVFTLMALPGTVVALVGAVWRYDVTLQPSPSIVPAVLLTALMASSVGFGLGHAVRDPRVTNLITNLVIFGVLMFSPIAFPIENFPGWFAALHRVLPFYNMAVVVRGGLTDGVAGLPGSYLVLLAWTAGAWLLSIAVIGRRR